jgi:hypothetical protein
MNIRLIIFILFLLSLPAGAQVVYDFRNLGPAINSAQDEFLPVVYKDSLYIRRISASGKRGMAYDIVKVACNDIDINVIAGSGLVVIPVYKTKDYSNSSEPIDEMESTKPRMKADPSTPSFFNFSSDKLSIYKLANPETLDFGISTEFNDMHPALAPDGSFIVFASDRPKKRGAAEREKDLDLYISFRKPDNTWSKPQNLGKKINTKENDFTPYIAQDGSLYFSSKGYIRDNVNIVFSGEKNGSKKKLSDIHIIKERLNYNIIKAGATGNQKEPFASPVMLPDPINTEFNEIGPTIWKDTLIYLASDRMEPYDRPDPLNKSGYDIYGYVADPLPPQPQKPPPLAFFDTGYYIPNTIRNLAELRGKYFSGVFGTNPSNDYVADPNNDYDENGDPINYDAYAVQVEEYFENVNKNLSRWLNFIDNDRRGGIEITISGYSDPRALLKESKFVEASIDDKDFGFSFKRGSAVTNDSLSLLRAYYTARHIRNRLESGRLFQVVKNKVKWKIEGKGILVSKDINEQKRKFDIVVTYN